MLQKDFLKNKIFWRITFYALVIKNHAPSDTEGFGSVYFLCHKKYC